MKTKSTPKEIFSYLLMIATLYIGVGSFIALLFQYINFLFPDQLSYSYNSISGVVRASMANLIILWPVFVFMAWSIEKLNKKSPDKRDLRSRAWLLYLTLFIAAGAIIIDLISLINNFLKGDLTIKFFLKLLVVMVVAGAVFGYYLWDLKKRKQTKSSIPGLFAKISSLVILIAIIAGFFIIGSPAHQRDLRIDNERVQDLNMIQSEIINYWRNKETLPKNLTDLEDSISGFIPPQDPDTDKDYDYNLKDNFKFELCATFATDNKGDKYNTKYYRGFDKKWLHDKGKVCWDKTIDPDLYNTKVLMENRLPIIYD
ncbi:hypothetical protein ISS06_00865 [Patescibacteria group bacterium]|nr:hypothetical protein [Patescibacteria group bacterium]